MKFKIYDRVRLLKGSLKGQEGFLLRKLNRERAVLSFSKQRWKRKKGYETERSSSFSIANLRHIDSSGRISKIYKDSSGLRRHRSDRKLTTGEIYKIVVNKRRILAKKRSRDELKGN